MTDEANVGPLPEEARQQILSYLRHQASKSNADLVALVDRAEGVVARSLEGVDESQARWCPEPGEWCIAEVLSHVQAAMAGNARIVESLAAGKEASIKGIEPVVKLGTETLAALREGVARSFDELRAAIRAAPGGDAPATTNHPFFGDLTWKEWASFAYVHARDHADQIEKVKARSDFER
jgi:hypothetical protein